MENMKKLILQLIKFGGTGVVCFAIDYGVLCFLKEVLHVNVFLSAAVAFTVSVVVNYILSVKFVFETNPHHSKKRNFILFIIFSVIGLGLTELIMKIGIDGMGINYMITKIAATAIVMVFNFVTRKLFLEK